MTIRLNETLRPLRQKAGLTQSALAEKLGVSDGAVSRWETAEALPDITLLPRLAAILHVSVDALLGVDSQRRQSAIDEALAASGAAMAQGHPQCAVDYLRTALRAWPDEAELMVALARALMALHTDDGAREALALCRSADGRPARLSTQYGCKQLTALALHRLGRSEQAAQLVSDELPSFWVCRELLYPRVAPPDKAQSQRQFNLLWLADHMGSTLREMAKAAADPQLTIQLMEKAVRIYREAAGDHPGIYGERVCQAWLRAAQAHASLGQAEEALHALRLAVAEAEAYAAHNGRYTAPWLPDAHDRATSPQDARALSMRLLSAMTDAPLSSLQDLPAFRELLRCLSSHPDEPGRP